MGRDRGKKQNPFAAKKRNKRQMADKPDKRSEPYKEIVRENESFDKYYKVQKICKDEVEWSKFLAAIKDNLPTTFRVTGFKDEAKALLELIKTKLFESYVEGVSELHQIPKEKVERPLCLPWYPEGLAWQLHLTRKDIRRSEHLFRLHNFLIVETSAGSISRQEAVSMIPPLVLDVKPTDKVLDMCAAPGSKTAQLIEALHAESDNKIPPGFVVANDVDNNRCYMLVHQAKRLNSPCFVVTNHDSSHFPNLLKTNPDGSQSVLKFDKILCDVPCSGDGTMRKNPDIWTKWNSAQGTNLHGIQYRITRRGAEMLEVGGRLVYSTCSMNPIENEAVLQRIIQDSDGALEIVDGSSLVPGLKFNPGMTDWVLASKDLEIFTSFDQVPEKYHTVIRPNMFPLPAGEIEKIGLEKCMRILPHLQDTGAFFVAVLQKKKKLPFEKNDAEALEKPKEKVESTDGTPTEEAKSAPWGPQRKRRRLHGYKEDPYVFFKDDENVFNEIKSFYELNDAFDRKSLLTRCNNEKKKNIYYCSEPIRDLVLLNEDSVKIINTGVKTFVRCENRYSSNSYRLAQEGLQTSNAFIGESRRIEVSKEDFILLLQCTDPTKPPSTTELSEDTQKRAKELGVGSCILKYVDKRFTLFVVGWRGSSSLRAYVDVNETVHILRLLGADLSKFEKNKFKKVEDNAVVEEKGEEDDADIVADEVAIEADEAVEMESKDE
ncbi:tRNA (cytosine(34)-C(5))-methyltransferase [Episyrphus balteatus]|uniref:tRNA (cytosine(34)-C(5))-methyltransferase n=1 Tax=Episyrphus balteatus TaxID=286459 RepID=UPI0024854A20|nr:tRNA (cytosine(34)-C(5))-methyltransferase [Episyrphus balteatus]